MIVKFGIMDLGTERVLAELSGEGRDNAATARKNRSAEGRQFRIAI
jgi:hypothetical protein